MNSLTWTYLFTYGYDLEIWGWGKYRVGYCKGKQILGYIKEVQ